MKLIKSKQSSKKTNRSGMIGIKNEFKALDHRTIDSKSRITLAPSWINGASTQPIRSFQVYQNEDGDILLRPEVTIPARETWIYNNPKLLAALEKGLNETKEGKGEAVEDIDSFLENL